MRAVNLLPKDDGRPRGPAFRNDPLVIASYLGTDERAIQRSDAVPGSGAATAAAEPSGAVRAHQ